jgi:hypothetical protein
MVGSLLCIPLCEFRPTIQDTRIKGYRTGQQELKNNDTHLLILLPVCLGSMQMGPQCEEELSACEIPQLETCAQRQSDHVHHAQNWYVRLRP